MKDARPVPPPPLPLELLLSEIELLLGAPLGPVLDRLVRWMIVCVPEAKA